MIFEAWNSPSMNEEFAASDQSNCSLYGEATPSRMSKALCSSALAFCNFRGFTTSRRPGSGGCRNWLRGSMLVWQFPLFPGFRSGFRLVGFVGVVPDLAQFFEVFFGGGGNDQRRIDQGVERLDFPTVGVEYCLPEVSLEVWPESHWPGFAPLQVDVLQSYTAW